MDDRKHLSNECWEAFVPYVRALSRYGRKTDLRRFVEAVVWVLRTGCPWRDLHESFGPWATVYRRFRRWALAGRWRRLHEALTARLPEIASLLIDSTCVRAHGHAAGAAGGQKHQALGRSRGGFGTKIHAAVSEGGRLLSLRLTGAQRSDIQQAEPLLEAAAAENKSVICDKAYDSDRFLAAIARRGCVAVIPSRRNRRHPRELDVSSYRGRNVVERFFGRIKQYRRVSTRYDKTVASYASFLFVGVAMLHFSGWR